MLELIASILVQGHAPAGLVELGEQEEIAMALSAAPEHLRGGAGIYRLGPAGYVAVRPSANGFNCLVAREGNHGIGPMCFDKEGSETTLDALLMRGELQQSGKTEAEIDAEIAKAYETKRLIAPRRAGVAYMLSNHFRQVNPKTGKDECIFPPHVMYYAPYMKNADIGSAKKFGSTDVPWVLNEGKPDAYIIQVDRDADIAACK